MQDHFDTSETQVVSSSGSGCAAFSLVHGYSARVHMRAFEAKKRELHSRVGWKMLTTHHFTELIYQHTLSLNRYFDTRKAMRHQIRVTDEEWKARLLTTQDASEYAAALAASASFRFYPTKNHSFQSGVKFVDGELSLTKKEKENRLRIPLPCNQWPWWTTLYYVVMGLCLDVSELLFEQGYEDMKLHCRE